MESITSATGGSAPETGGNDKSKKQRISWAKLLKRVFNINVSTCPMCQGKVRIIAAIEDPAIIIKILTHLGLASRAPRVHLARGPPYQNDLIDFDMSEMPPLDAYVDSIFES